MPMAAAAAAAAIRPPRPQARNETCCAAIFKLPLNSRDSAKWQVVHREVSGTWQIVHREVSLYELPNILPQINAVETSRLARGACAGCAARDGGNPGADGSSPGVTSCLWCGGITGRRYCGMRCTGSAGWPTGSRAGTSSLSQPNPSSGVREPCSAWRHWIKGENAASTNLEHLVPSSGGKTSSHASPRY